MLESIPPLKEYRIEKIIEALNCFDLFPLNREKQKICIFNFYRGQYKKPIDSFDKAIFRGMVIPSLRYLGLIIGYGDFIKVSSNGKLILESSTINEKLKNITIRAIVLEIDMSKYHFLSFLEDQLFTNIQEFIAVYFDNSPEISKKQKEERISKWLTILLQVQLISQEQGSIHIHRENFNSSKKILDVENINFKEFEKSLLQAYVKISEKSAGIVEIENLRLAVSMTLFKDSHVILTEQMFDDLFAKLIENQEDLTFSLGRPMGKHEKLFKFRENYFKTVYIKKNSDKL